MTLSEKMKQWADHLSYGAQGFTSTEQNILAKLEEVVALAKEMREAMQELSSRYEGVFDDYIRSSYSRASEADGDLNNSLIGIKETLTRADALLGE
jgi:hypothetical protein